MPRIEAKIHPQAIPETELGKYVGSYGNINISKDGERLYFHSRGAKSELTPLGADLFDVRDFDFFRLQFAAKDGKITAVEMQNDDGTSRKLSKEN